MAELEVGHTPAQLVAAQVTRHAADTLACLHCRQVNLMRFSAIFQQPVPQREARPEEAVRENPPPATSPGQDLPEDLDARVRLVGEWQLGEA